MRQVKFFKVRLPPGELKADEAWLNQFLVKVRIRKILPSLVQTPREIFWSVYVEFEDGEPKRSTADEATTPQPLTEAEAQLYEALRAWRNARASRENVPAFFVFHNKHLEEMARAKSRSVNDIAAIQGVGRARAERYGPELLRVIKGFEALPERPSDRQEPS